MKLPIDSRSNSGVKIDQQQFNFDLFIPSLGRSNSGSTTARQRGDSGAIAVQQCSDGRSDSSGATVAQYRCDSGATV